MGLQRMILSGKSGVSCTEMSNTHEFWYEEVIGEDSLRQGDIFIGLRCYWLASDLAPGNAEAAVKEHTGTWIVAQASCDMEWGALKRIVVLQMLPASRETLRLGAGDPDRELKKRREVIRRGAYPRRFLIPACPNDEASMPLSVVVWESLLTLPTEYLRNHYCNGPRLRLKSPLREKFGNWVGERFSAVGPEDEAVIPRFVPIYDDHLLRTSDSLGRKETPLEP